MLSYSISDISAAARDDQESRDFLNFASVDGGSRRRRTRTKARRRAYAARRAARFARRFKVA